MALVLPAHRIHSIYGGFGASTLSLPMSADQFTQLPNISCAAAAARFSPPGLSKSGSRAAPSTPVTTRPRRLSVIIPTSNRRAPPPPPRATRAAPRIVIDDPFADDVEDVLTFTPRSRVQSVQPHTQPSTHTLPPLDFGPRRSLVDDPVSRKEANARFVANALLSRTCGRPRRFMAYGEGTRPYVRSCLSRMVEVEC